MPEGTTISFGNSKIEIREKVFDHAVDSLAVVGIVISSTIGEAAPPVIGGLVSIALGKRIIKK